MVTRAYRRWWKPLILLSSLIVLSSCNTSESSKLGLIENTPQSQASQSSQSGSSEPVVNGLADNNRRHEPSDEQKRIAELFKKAKDTATPLVKVSQTSVYEQVTKPLFDGELLGNKITTWLVLGGDVSPENIEISDRVVTAYLTNQDDERLGTVTAAIINDHLRPTSFTSTSRGSQWYTEHESEIMTWATN